MFDNTFVLPRPEEDDTIMKQIMIGSSLLGVKDSFATSTHSSIVEMTDNITGHISSGMRVGKAFGRALRKQLPQGTISTLGEEFSRRLPATHWRYIRYSDTMYWDSGDFGDNGSCYWNDYEEAKWFFDNSLNSGYLQLFSDTPGDQNDYETHLDEYGYAHGIARAIVASDERGIYVMNGYSAGLAGTHNSNITSRIATALAYALTNQTGHLHLTKYSGVSIFTDGTDVYINSNIAYTVAPATELEKMPDYRKRIVCVGDEAIANDKGRIKTCPACNSDTMDTYDLQDSRAQYTYYPNESDFCWECSRTITMCVSCDELIKSDKETCGVFVPNLRDYIGPLTYQEQRREKPFRTERHCLSCANELAKSQEVKVCGICLDVVDTRLTTDLTGGIAWMMQNKHTEWNPVYTLASLDVFTSTQRPARMVRSKVRNLQTTVCQPCVSRKKLTSCRCCGDAYVMLSIGYSMDNEDGVCVVCKESAVRCSACNTTVLTRSDDYKAALDVDGTALHYHHSCYMRTMKPRTTAGMSQHYSELRQYARDNTHEESYMFRIPVTSHSYSRLARARWHESPWTHDQRNSNA